jgi:plastocyanin
VGVSRVAWTILSPLCVVLAIAAVVTIARENRADPAAEAAQGDTVTMEDIAFSPGQLTVARGTQIVFDNKDVAPHTVTADDGSVDSEILDPGKTFSVVASEGFSYHCEIHPSMKAEIRLEG